MPRTKNQEFTLPFSRRMRKAMILRGMNSADLCRRTRLGHGQISNYLNGHQCPRADRLLEICQALDVSADYMLGLKNRFK